jgi:hypothetical protein
MEALNPTPFGNEGKEKQKTSTTNAQAEEQSLPHIEAINQALHRLGWVNIEPLSARELLDNTIHPLYRRSRWTLGIDECSLLEPRLRFLEGDRYSKDMGQVFANMIPSLRLATLWITNDDLLDFWVRLLCQTAGPDSKHYTTEDAPDAKEKVRAVFAKMATNTRLTFGTECLNTRKPQWEWAWGICAWHPDLLKYTMATSEKYIHRVKGSVSLAWRKDDRDCCAPVIALNLRFRHFFRCSRQDFAALPEGDKLRKQFIAAKIILHETAHAFVHVARGRPGLEPLTFPTDAIAEAGFSWEEYMFRGIG